MSNISRTFGAFLVASVSFAAMASGAVAQVAQTSPDNAAEDNAREGGLQDIVVTARKRNESLQDIPVAITAYTPVQIQRLDLTSLERVAVSTPNLTIGRSTSGSGAQITLRGIGSPASAVGVESSTAIIIDGVYYSNGRALTDGLFDVARIEVLKGPQALFFGKNATAGALSITTAEPGSQFEASTKVGYEFKAQQVYGEQIVSSPITDTLGIRAAVRMSRMFGSYTTNLATPQAITVTDVAGGPAQSFIAPPAEEAPKEKTIIGRLTLKWQPDENLTNTLKVSGGYDRMTDLGWNNIVFSCPNGVTQLSGNAPCGRNWVYYHNEIPASIGATFPIPAEDGHLFYKYWSYQVTNNLEYKLPGLTLTALTNWQRQQDKWTNDGDYQQAVNQIYTDTNESQRFFSEEIRAQTAFEFPVNLMAGLLYQRSRVNFFQGAFGGGNVRNSAAPDPSLVYLGWLRHSYTNGRTISPFFQLAWKVTPQIEVTGGARYTDEVKDTFYVMDYVRPGVSFRQNVPVNAHQKFTNWSPEATITYHPSSNITLYGSYKTGYKSGGFSNSSLYTNTSSPSDFQFQPERVKGFEGGIKSTLLDRQLRLDIAAFNYKYSNLQLDFYEAQSFRYITTNAGASRTKGIEVSAEFAPRSMPGLTLRGSVNYVKARYITFIAPCVTGQTPAQGCNTTNTFGGLGQNLSGHPTAMAPDWTGSLGVSYEADLGSDLRAGFVIDSRYSGSYNASAFGNPIAIQPRYVNLDTTLYLRSEKGWEVSLIGKNLTNQFVVAGALDSPSTGSGTGTATGRLSDQRGYVNPPRTVALQVTYRY